MEHLVANLFALALFAPRLERRNGHAVLAAAFVALHVAAFSEWAVSQTAGSYFGVGASGAIVGLAAFAVYDAAHHREWGYAAAVTAFGVWWWWPDGFTSSDQVHLAGALAGLCFGLLAAWPWAGLAGIAAVGAAIVVAVDPRVPPRPRIVSCPDSSYDTPSTKPARFFFRNERGQVLDLYWVRPSGDRDFVGPLGPGDHLIERSYVGAHFVLTTDRGRCVNVLEVR